MNTWKWLGTILLLWVPSFPAYAGLCHRKFDLDQFNQTLSGKVLDFTDNHGSDRRIWSEVLGQKRDIYVYVPPGFDPSRQYPSILWFHGFMQDEQAIFSYQVIAQIDRAIACGKLPPLLLIAPDGSLSGEARFLSPGSFFVNSKAGRFEDYIIQDVWSFFVHNFPVRPESEAHIIAGVSMGGFGAFNLAIKHPDIFHHVVGIFPPLNLRWVDCHCRYMSNFDPCCWGWRTETDRGFEVIGRFYAGLVSIRLKRVLDPLFGLGPEALEAVKRENPIEMIDAYGLKDGVLHMYIAYGGKDEFNIDAQVESFLYRATKQRGISVDVGYDPKGQHNVKTSLKLFPGIITWMGSALEPFRLEKAMP